MRKEEFEKIARQKPFKRFEVRLVDGRKFLFTSPEQFIVGRTTIAALDEDGEYVLINLGRVATVHERNGNGKRKS